MNNFNEKKANKALAELIDIFQSKKFTIGEILIVYGNLGYALGASIDGYQNKGPSISELKNLYYKKPSIGIAMMLQGVTVTTWADQYFPEDKKI